MPTYVALLYGPDFDASAYDPESDEVQAEMAEYQEFEEKARAAGVVLGGEALEPAATATTVHRPDGKDGEVVRTDGPFAETKEVLGGFYLLKCADLDEAIDWASQIPGAWRGRVEVRPVADIENM
jgi:hypothetical protein